MPPGMRTAETPLRSPVEARPLRVGVDATCWQNPRGYGRHARALLSALVRLDVETRYVLFVDFTDSPVALPSGADVRRVRATAPTVTAAAAAGHRALGDAWRMSRALSDASLDVLLFPTIYSYVPVVSRAKKVVMIHDVIADTYPRLTLPSLRARLLWRAKTALGRWQAHAIVTVSEHSRRGLLERFRIAPERVRVVGEASDPIFRPLADPRPTPRLGSLGITGAERVVVYVGGFSPHKNLEPLVAAFAALTARPAFGDARLVMVGDFRQDVFHSYFDTVRARVHESGLDARVIFTGYLPDEELVVLLNVASVLVLPSLLEGFGLPAVEAAACGCAVIATTASPLPVLLGEGGLYVDPTREDELTDALARVLGSDALRGRMRAAALAAARRLTWDAAGRQMIALLRDVAAR